jgi:hypothetical protein
MPRGPRGEKRPADVIGTAVMVARIATGEITEAPRQKSGKTRSGKAGSEARKKRLTPERRAAIAKKAAAARCKRSIAIPIVLPPFEGASNASTR